MQFTIRHRTLYSYSKPVHLGPQLLRFHPREEGGQRVVDYRLDVSPEPVGVNDHVDLAGNRALQAWFDAPTESLDILVVMSVETLRQDPFDFILDEAAMQLPVCSVDAPMLARSHLERPADTEATDAIANEIRARVCDDTLRFLHELNRFLFEDFEAEVRDQGAPRPPPITLATRRGACRDLAMVFIDCCRSVGIPARFASGYQAGGDGASDRQLHAWPEVHLPGAGWRGYDPTHGSAVADRHVTICAAPRPEETLPVSGGYGSGQGARTTLDFELSIEASDA